MLEVFSLNLTENRYHAHTHNNILTFSLLSTLFRAFFLLSCSFLVFGNWSGSFRFNDFDGRKGKRYFSNFKIIEYRFRECYLKVYFYFLDVCQICAAVDFCCRLNFFPSTFMNSVYWVWEDDEHKKLFIYRSILIFDFTCLSQFCKLFIAP